MPRSRVSIPEEVGESSLAPSYALQHQRYIASGGHATRKAIIDQPPSGTTLASFPLSGNKKTMNISVTVPSSPSLRPDGKHFIYAVVHAGGYRTWTAPIFTTNTITPQITSGRRTVNIKRKRP